MRSFRAAVWAHKGAVLVVALGIGSLTWLLLYKLANLTGGLSASELKSVSAPVGWHGIYNQPLDLPLKLLRSVVFYLFPDHGQLLSRLPNAIFGGLSIGAFALLIRSWHSTRTAVLTSLLFATSAWVLHVSRLASFDVQYLWALPTLLLAHLLLQKRGQRILLWYGSILITGLLLYIPGMVWFVALNTYLQRALLKGAWKHFKRGWQRLTYVMAGLIWLPLLLIDLSRPGQLLQWLGLPSHLAPPPTLIKQFVAVPVHLFIRGPRYPDIWLNSLPILDIFTLAVCVIGIYFYARHRQAIRSRLLGMFFCLGVILIGLGGPVALSLLVPVLYMAAATGITYLLREWLSVFPLNPLARGLGIGLISLAVTLSCAYNLRAYFIAWPHNEATKITFRYRL